MKDMEDMDDMEENFELAPEDEELRRINEICTSSIKQIEEAQAMLAADRRNLWYECLKGVAYGIAAFVNAAIPLWLMRDTGLALFSLILGLIAAIYSNLSYDAFRLAEAYGTGNLLLSHIIRKRVLIETLFSTAFANISVPIYIISLIIGAILEVKERS